MARDLRAPDVLVSAQCISEGTYADTVGPISTSVDWKLILPHQMELKQYLQLKCDDASLRPGLKKILPIVTELNPVLIYDNCKANIYTAIKRDSLGVTKPERRCVDLFIKYYDKIFDEEIAPLLDGFEYDFNSWYNHLNVKQQKNLKQVDFKFLKKRRYKMFCKAEKQEVTSNDKAPKNRCICGPNEEYKYVMGPVVHRLEAIFKKKFKGYCSGKNWSDRETDLNNRRRAGLRRVAQGDGSAFDRSQDHELKYVERKIYNYLADHGYIRHVDVDVFLQHALAKMVPIHADFMVKHGKHVYMESLGFINKTGGVQSGNCDTSFANTLRMVMYNRFVMEEYLHLEPQAYGLDCAGDDFAAFLPMTVSVEQAVEAYLQVFVQTKTPGVPEFGNLGQVLKFLKFSDIDGVDFCSTETYWSPRVQSYKITRRLDRFFTLTPYSRQALSMSHEEQRDYLLQLHESNLSWMRGLPILSEYNDLLRVFAHRQGTTKPVKVKNGRSAIILPTTAHFDKLYLDSSLERFKALENALGSDDAYAFRDRVSDKTDTELDYRDYLRDQYGLSRGEQYLLQRQLSSLVESSPGQEVSLPLLRHAIDHRATRELSVLADKFTTY